MPVDLRKETLKRAKNNLDALSSNFFTLKTMGFIDEGTWENHIAFDLANMGGLLTAIETSDAIKEINDSGL